VFFLFVFLLARFRSGPFPRAFNLDLDEAKLAQMVGMVGWLFRGTDGWTGLLALLLRGLAVDAGW